VLVSSTVRGFRYSPRGAGFSSLREERKNHRGMFLGVIVIGTSSLE
jgi:hypothetical protein